MTLAATKRFDEAVLDNPWCRRQAARHMPKEDPQRLRANPLVTAERMAGGGVLMDAASGECFELNRTGIEVWEAVVRDGSVAELVRDLAQRHGVSEQQVSDDVAKVVAAMIRRGLVAPVPP